MLEISDETLCIFIYLFLKNNYIMTKFPKFKNVSNNNDQQTKSYIKDDSTCHQGALSYIKFVQKVRSVNE